MRKIVVLFVLLKLTSAVMLSFFSGEGIYQDTDFKSSIIEETVIQKDSVQLEVASMAVER